MLKANQINSGCKNKNNLMEKINEQDAHDDEKNDGGQEHKWIKDYLWIVSHRTALQI
jgi:hypothetical protein